MSRNKTHLGSKLTSRHGTDGPRGLMRHANPLVWSSDPLRRMLPSMFGENKEHYDTRTLQCVKCGNVPKQRALLDDTPDGYVCRAAKSCAERAKESYD